MGVQLQSLSYMLQVVKDELDATVPRKYIERAVSINISRLPPPKPHLAEISHEVTFTMLTPLSFCGRFWHETSDPWVRFSSAQLA